jgi:hypothetical protein
MKIPSATESNAKAKATWAKRSLLKETKRLSASIRQASAKGHYAFTTSYLSSDAKAVLESKGYCVSPVEGDHIDGCKVTITWG